jgi:hypothetical protein
MMAVVVAKAAILGMLQARGRVCTFNAVGRARAEPQKKKTGTVSAGSAIKWMREPWDGGHQDVLDV